MKHWKAELLLVLITFIWGGTFLFTKIGLEYCPPSLYIIFRFIIAFAISFAVFGRHLFKTNKQTLLHGLILGLFFGGGFVLQTYGLKFTTVSKSAFITGVSVVLVPFVYKLVEKKNIRLWPKIGVVIAFIGLWIFTNPEFDNINIGDIYTLLSCIFWALYITYMDVFTRGKSDFGETARLVMFQFTAAAPVALVTFLLFELDGLYLNWDIKLLYSLAYNGIIASFMLTFIHTSVQRYTTPVKAALIFALEPVLASFFAVLFISETLGGREYIGGIILLSGVLISETGDFFYQKLKGSET